jgi:hypothetical protein
MGVWLESCLHARGKARHVHVEICKTTPKLLQVIFLLHTVQIHGHVALHTVHVKCAL